MTPPVLGILAPRGTDPARPFGPISSFVAEVFRLARSEGADVVGFSGADIAPDGSVRAARPLSAGGWARVRMPMPPVVWCRSPSLSDSLRAGAHAVLLNQPGKDKWSDHTSLARHAGVRPHLPDTVLLTCGDDVRGMLARHEALYLKPIRGSLGLGISRVRRAGPGRALVDFVADGVTRTREIDLSECDAWCARRGVAGGYVVQQGLELFRFEGRPLDLRVIVQKDGGGVWRVTGSGARIAEEGRYTTNLQTGGRAVLVPRVLRAFAPGSPSLQDALSAQLEALAIEIAGRVDLDAGGMGELGLDFGLDGTGHLWYIEHNTQPGRGIFERTGRVELFRESLLRPVRYARHLRDVGGRPTHAATA